MVATRCTGISHQLSGSSQFGEYWKTCKRWNFFNLQRKCKCRVKLETVCQLNEENIKQQNYWSFLCRNHQEVLVRQRPCETQILTLPMSVTFISSTKNYWLFFLKLSCKFSGIIWNDQKIILGRNYQWATLWKMQEKNGL